MPFELVRTTPSSRPPVHVQRELDRIDHQTLYSARKLLGLDLLGRVGEEIVLSQSARLARAETPTAALALAEVGEVVRFGVRHELMRFVVSA